MTPILRLTGLSSQGRHFYLTQDLLDAVASLYHAQLISEYEAETIKKRIETLTGTNIPIVVLPEG